MSAHLLAAAVLDRGAGADRFRNHLRRRAITRVGLIEGDLYFLPFWRCSGLGPEGETTFHVLAAEVGDERLHRANLPPADLAPFDPAAVPAGARLVKAESDRDLARARAASRGWRVDALEELIHYPFWLMRIEDASRIEGGWIDGVEGKVIHHTLKVPSPAPSLGRSAAILAVPAALMAASSFAPWPAGPLAAILAGAGAYAVIGAILAAGESRQRRG